MTELYQHSGTGIREKLIYLMVHSDQTLAAQERKIQESYITERKAEIQKIAVILNNLVDVYRT